MEIMRSMPPNENVVQLQYFTVEADIAARDTRLLTLYMDYLPSNLYYLIQQHATGMPISLVRIYVRQLLSGLSHLASQNVVHRDLLPRNILIDPSRQVLKLADFGCAKIVTARVSNYPKVGSWQYRAVELLFGATHYDSKAGMLSNIDTYF
jgi:serine/threonine protein kinase